MRNSIGASAITKALVRRMVLPGGDSGSDSIGKVGVDGDVGAEGVGSGVEAAAASGTRARA